MGLATAHDPDIACDDLRLEPETLEDPNVGALLRLVTGVEACLVQVAAVGILHDEFTDAEKAAAGAGLVAPFRLEVVEHHGQLAIRPDDVGEEQPHDFLMGHCQDHLPAGPVLEPRQLRPDRVVPATGLPDVGRMDNRHLDFLAADPIHLLADHLFDPLADPEAERQQRIDAGSELTDVAGPDKQPMRRHVRVGRIVAERGEEELAQAHGGKNSRRGSLLAFRPCRTT